MGEFADLVKAARGDEKKLALVLERMEPLIRNRARKLYMEDPDDMRSELCIAIWIAIGKMDYFDDDGQVTRYLTRAVNNRYLELCRTSRKLHDNEMAFDTDIEGPIMCDAGKPDERLDEFLLRHDLYRMLNTCTGIKRRIVGMIVSEDKSDSEIAGELAVSRQYVNRVRRSIRDFIEGR